MKRKHLLTVGVMCCALYFSASAQLSPSQKLLPPKRLLFSKLPDQFDVGDQCVHQLFATTSSGSIKIPLSANHYFEGIITEKVQVNPNVVNVNVRSSNFDGAMLSISRITYNNQKVKYIGRIVSISYGDVFLLTHENNQLHFKKQKQSLVITE